MSFAGIVGCPACATAHGARSFTSRSNDYGILAHVQIIIGTPHRHFALHTTRMDQSFRKSSGRPRKFRKDAVPSLTFDRCDGTVESRLVVHHICLLPPNAATGTAVQLCTL